MNPLERIRLRDGRQLAYAEYGDPAGLPVLYFHGSPSSRLEPALVGDAAWRALGLRIIAPDRPGIGESSFQACRSIPQWAGDVSELADHLGLERFSVLGNSGGAPYVAACAARIPQRLRSAVIVSGGWRMDLPEARRNMPLPNRIFLGLAAHAPVLMRLMLKAMAASTGGGDRAADLKSMRGRMPAADVEAFSAPCRIEAFQRAMKECVKRGTRGAAWDLRLYMREFGFSLCEVKIPLMLFHGDQDANAPLPLVKRMLEEMPFAKLTLYPGEAHLSTLCNRIGDVARALRQA